MVVFFVLLIFNNMFMCICKFLCKVFKYIIKSLIYYRNIGWIFLLNENFFYVVVKIRIYFIFFYIFECIFLILFFFNFFILYIFMYIIVGYLIIYCF